MHNAVFERLDLDWVYLPLPTEPGNLKTGIAGLRALSFVGSNISVPHKTQVVQFMDELDAAAKQMQAVNTIKIVDGRLVGSNTDPVGFVRQLTAEGVNPNGMKILMIGAGGAARAAIFGLSQFKVNQIVVMDVVESRAASLVSDLACLFKPECLKYSPLAEKHFSECSNNCDLVVNATPIGMTPQEDASPWPDGVDLPKNAVFYDIVYNPQQTKFLFRATSQGHKTISGLGMLVHQGAASFEIWTGIQPPIDVMLRVSEEALAIG
jgi:shikimate dehydrogenase